MGVPPVSSVAKVKTTPSLAAKLRTSSISKALPDAPFPTSDLSSARLVSPRPSRLHRRFEEFLGETATDAETCHSVELPLSSDFKSEPLNHDESESDLVVFPGFDQTPYPGRCDLELYPTQAVTNTIESAVEFKVLPVTAFGTLLVVVKKALFY